MQARPCLPFTTGHYMSFALEPRHPMKSVVHRTGLSPPLIRVWEKRYGAVVPQGTATNRRFYSDADIERLRLLGQAIRAGCSIGHIAQLPLEQLVALATPDYGRCREAASQGRSRGGWRQ